MTVFSDDFVSETIVMTMVLTFLRGFRRSLQIKNIITENYQVFYNLLRSQKYYQR